MWHAFASMFSYLLAMFDYNVSRHIEICRLRAREHLYCLQAVAMRPACECMRAAARAACRACVDARRAHARALVCGPTVCCSQRLAARSTLTPLHLTAAPT